VTFYAADAGDEAGPIVSGDFSGDGVQDVVVGAAMGDGPGNDRTDSGEVYFFAGPFQPGSSLDAASSQEDAVFYGASPSDQFGRGLAAGDFNGDGIDDLAIAATGANSDGGAVYVMLGGRWSVSTDFASADPDVLINGSDAGDSTGLVMASADLDGDGKSELVIGAPMADGTNNTRMDAGVVYVLNGTQLVAGETIDLAQLTSTVTGAEPGDWLGESLTLGDVSGDGRPDLVLVATFADGLDNSRDAAGETYVMFSPVTLPLDMSAAHPDIEIIGTDSGDQLGHSIAVGDTDGDGKGDIWLGAVSADGPGNQTDLAGEAALVPGTATGVVDTALGQAQATIYGQEMTARLGRSLAVGDINGDGKADLLISAPNMADRAGRVFVFDGGGSYPADTTGANLTLGGLDAGDVLGHESLGKPSLSVADVDGDGRVDVLVSAPTSDGPDNQRTDGGEAYVIPGSSLGD
jgi:hypothetical protein